MEIFAILFPLLIVALIYSAHVTLCFIHVSKKLREEKREHETAKEIVIALSKENHRLFWIAMKADEDVILEAETIE